MDVLSNSIDQFRDNLENIQLSRASYNKIIYLTYDLKYMAKPLTAPNMIHNTDFLDQLLETLTKLYFVDSIN
jgi:hypothetical protein